MVLFLPTWETFRDDVINMFYEKREFTCKWVRSLESL